MKTAVRAAREYTFRVAAPETADEVDVSIDRGPWRPCRRAAGYWWFDWSGAERVPRLLTAALSARA